MRARLVRIAAGGSIAVALAVIPACGSSSGNSSACKSIKNTLTSLNSQASSVSTNPTAAGKAYSDAAGQIRDASKKGSAKLSNAAGQLADVLDSLGKALSQPITATSTPTLPDTSKLTQASKDLQDICG